MSEQSTTIAELAKALSAAQGMMSGAKKAGVNPHFKSRYADLASIIDAIREPFAKHGLAHVQSPGKDAEGYFVDTTIMHVSGEWIKGRIRMNPAQDTPQGIGSLVTYSRRYALQAMAGLEAEDDDGNHASGNPSQPARKPEALKEGSFKNLEPVKPKETAAGAKFEPQGEWTKVEIHFGKKKGTPLGHLDDTSLEWWLDLMSKKASPQGDDLTLFTALKEWKDEYDGFQGPPPDDDDLKY